MHSVRAQILPYVLHHVVDLVAFILHVIIENEELQKRKIFLHLASVARISIITLSHTKRSEGKQTMMKSMLPFEQLKFHFKGTKLQNASFNS